MKGVCNVKAFDNTKKENYKNEVIQKWGNTNAYIEYEEKTKDYSKEKFSNLLSEMNEIFQSFAECNKSNIKVETTEVQCLVSKLQNHITTNYYNCTNDILNGLADMYLEDNRFKSNIDKFYNGTAKYVNQAIKFYCNN